MSGERRRAGFVSRVGADLIDAVIVSVVTVVAVLGVRMFSALFAGRVFTFPKANALEGAGIVSLLFLVYLTFFWATIGRTPGKQAIGLRIVTSRGEQLSWPRALGRAAFCVVLPVGLLLAVVSRRNAAVHDLVLRTAVVYDFAPRRRSRPLAVATSEGEAAPAAVPAAPAAVPDLAPVASIGVGRPLEVAAPVTGNGHADPKSPRRDDVAPAVGSEHVDGGGSTPRRPSAEGGHVSDTATADDVQVGPIDFILVEWPADHQPNGEAMPHLIDLVDRGVIRILDLAFIRKEMDGTIVRLEIADFGDDEGIMVFEGVSSGVIGDDDVDEASGALEPGATAALLVYENTWAAPFATALRKAGAQLVATGRIPTNALISALDELESANS
jgi:uncharacterized RDD family membrane protein YckC